MSAKLVVMEFRRLGRSGLNVSA
ncbi:MAG: hypothetical protein JWN20_648, partial [Jatrophihabitantaceae bacterium]|nr:hypothetical protein [Jatrophihabitantaceae bacterium]